MPKRFLIVEDHPLFRDALIRALDSQLNGCSVISATSIDEARAAATRGNAPDLALLDLWLPDSNGYEGLIELRRLCPKLPIVVMSAFADAVVVHKAMLLGAAGFISKSATVSEIIRALQDVFAGKVCLPAGYVPPATATTDEMAKLSEKLKSLTHQQLRVLQMVCQGRLNKEIAYQLNIGETTVKAHISEILRKLCVITRTQAVIEVSRLDLHSVSALYGR